jgi:hypothetical protein
MTSHFAAAWHHDHADEPVFMWHELDEGRNELRCVEEFRDGSRYRADDSHPDGVTGLSEKPMPTLDDIEAQPEFTVHPLTAQEFECIWETARYDR